MIPPVYQPERVLIGIPPSVVVSLFKVGRMDYRELIKYFLSEEPNYKPELFKGYRFRIKQQN